MFNDCYPNKNAMSSIANIFVTIKVTDAVKDLPKPEPTKCATTSDFF